MKKILLVSAFCLGFLGLESCNSYNISRERKEKIQEIPYTLAKNYFINNRITSAIPTKITTAKDFEKYFGLASFMGKNGEPTKINFEKEYIAVVNYGETDKKVEIIPQKLYRNKDKIVVEYAIKEGNRQGYISRPFQIWIISKKYNGEIILTRREVIS